MISKNLLITTSAVLLAACSGSKFTSNIGATDNGAGIVGGKAVAPNDPLSRTTVQVYSFDLVTQNGQQMVQSASCTATILTNDIVLSAAHCTNFNPNHMLLYFSDDIPTLQHLMTGMTPDDLRAVANTDPNARRVVAGITGVNWPKLTPDQQANWGDLSLIKFSGGLPPGYQPANLLPADAVLQAGEQILLAGFGLKNGVKDTQSQDLRKVLVTIANPNYSDTEMSLDTTRAKNSCHGDSGGPGYVTYNGQAYVAGVTSRADSTTDPNGQCIGGVIYTKVQPYLGWIQQTIQTLEDPNYQPQPIPQPQMDQQPSNP